MYACVYIGQSVPHRKEAARVPIKSSWSRLLSVHLLRAKLRSWAPCYRSITPLNEKWAKLEGAWRWEASMGKSLSLWKHAIVKRNLGPEPSEPGGGGGRRAAAGNCLQSNTGTILRMGNGVVLCSPGAQRRATRGRWKRITWNSESSKDEMGSILFTPSSNALVMCQPLSWAFKRTHRLLIVR